MRDVYVCVALTTSRRSHQSGHLPGLEVARDAIQQLQGDLAGEHAAFPWANQNVVTQVLYRYAEMKQQRLIMGSESSN